MGQLGRYRSIRRHRWSGNPSKESGGNAHVKRKEIEDGARFRPGRRIRVHSRGRWTHQQVVPQFCRDNAWPTRRRGNTDERTIIGVKRQGGCSTGFSVRGFRCLHALRSEDLQSTPLHCLLASAGRVLACEGNSRPLQLSSLALLLAGLSGGLSDAESGSCDAFGPLPTENREVGYTMAYSLAPGLSSGRQMQVRTLQPAEIADRVRHRSRSARSAVVGCGVSLVSHFLEGSGGRRVLLGRQHSAPRDALAGTWKQRAPKAREHQVAEVTLAGGAAALSPETSAPLGAVSTWCRGSSSKAKMRRNKRERSAAPPNEVKREAGTPPAKKPKDKGEGKGGKSRARHLLDQAGTQLCLSWNFGGGTYGELAAGSSCPAGSRAHKSTTCRSDKHPARQCPQS